MDSASKTTDATRLAIGEVIDSAYELLSFEPGSEPDWPEFNARFHPGAVLALRVFPGDDAVSVLSLEEYARAQMREGLEEEGYTETPGDREVLVVGDVASVRQEFTLNFADRPPQPAIDIFCLARVDDRWRIVSVVSDMSGRPDAAVL